MSPNRHNRNVQRWRKVLGFLKKKKQGFFNKPGVGLISAIGEAKQVGKMFAAVGTFGPHTAGEEVADRGGRTTSLPG